MAAVLSAELVKALTQAAPEGVATHVDLSALSRWRIGGTAAAVVEPASIDEVAAVMRVLSHHPVPRLVIGETSNLLFDDAGFDGVLLRLGARLSDWTINGTNMRVHGGGLVPQLVKAAAEAGLSGIVHAAGVPGTIGGLVCMNGGTQRKGIGEHVVSVTIVDEQGSIQQLTRADLNLAYRHTSLQDRSVAIVEVELALEPGDPATLIAEIHAILAQRAAKFPLDLPNCGSTFLSSPTMYATIGPPGRVIEDLGLKGLSRGGAQVSMKHANFIVNNGGATAADVLWLIDEIRRVVKARTGFVMDCEVRHLSAQGKLQPAHEAVARLGRPSGLPTR